MNIGSNIVESHSFVLKSSNEIFKTIQNIKLLQYNNDVIIYISSASHSSKLIQDLQIALKNAISQAQIILLKNNKKTTIHLSVYTPKDGTDSKNFANDVLSALYINNITKDNLIKEYKNKVFANYFKDNLTNLPNMYQLRADLEDNEDYTLIILNMDNFQVVNNFYGYIVGDFVIEQIGKYIKENILEHKIYRISGDEFALVINKKMFFYELKDHLSKLHTKIKNIVINYQDLNIFIDFTLASSTNNDNNNIFSKVSMALKHAKEIGSPFWIYENKMDFENEYEKNLRLYEVVKEAVNSLRIVPYYQAIVDTNSSKIKKYECLARLIDANGKILSPFNFIPVAKKIKVYDIVTKTIIDKSFDTFENLDFEFTINLSIEDIINKDIFNFIMNKLKNSKATTRVTFEIVESDAIEDFKKVERFINEVKRYGAKIAIDDFGSGYSNFVYLAKMDTDYIKIDGSLIKNLDTDKNTFAIVETIVEFAKKLNIKTVAEYVHSNDILEKVKSLGINYSQGFYLDKPSILISKTRQF